MRNKLTRIVFFILLAIILTIQPHSVSGAADVVGVRLMNTTNNALNRANIQAKIIIDYGSFIWALVPAGETQKMQARGMQYQVIENPFFLDLGGESFDPKFTQPTLPATWQPQQKNENDEGLRLIQFYGPIKDEWLTSLQKNDFKIVQYIHPFTYIVWGKGPLSAQFTEKNFIRWTGEFLPTYAVQPNVRGLNEEPILTRIAIYRQADVPSVIDAMQNLGGTLLNSTDNLDPTFNLNVFSLPGNQYQAAASLPGVYSVQPIALDGGNRGEMSNQINIGGYDGSNLAFPGYQSWLNSVGLSGSGVIIANVDSGVDQNHPDLANRMLPCVGSTCGGAATDPHGTHTAGIMAADGTTGITDTYGFLRGLGMAPGANLVEQVYSPTYLSPGGVLTLMTESIQNGAVISGNSWGPSGSPLGYDANTRLVDIGVRDADPGTLGNQPLSYILSIMNGNGGTSTQGTPDEAKNIFTIGSTKMQLSSGAQNLDINDLSSNTAHGPALDGRTIPHMVAPGCYVDSTSISASYYIMCGTSMASPHVSGAAALFYEYYRQLYGVDPSPALTKAAFLAVAYDLAGHLDADGGTLGHPFDSKQGWGRMNAAEVLDPTKDVAYYDHPVTFDNTGEIWSFDLVIEQPIPYLHLMLVWTDAPGHGLGGTTPAWNNDLDLSISDGTNTYYGNNFGPDGLSISGGTTDFMNNTEGIFMPPLTPGTYTITVTAANITSDGVPNTGDATDQDFALVYYLASFKSIFPLIMK